MSELLFYEDAPVGLSFDTEGMVVTESHVVQFAGLSGDFFALHMDDEFARSLGFSGRVAHGLLGLILVDGLKNRASQRFQAVASLSWQWNFRKPLAVSLRAERGSSSFLRAQTSAKGSAEFAIALKPGRAKIKSMLPSRARWATFPKFRTWPHTTAKRQF